MAKFIVSSLAENSSNAGTQEVSKNYILEVNRSTKYIIDSVNSTNADNLRNRVKADIDVEYSINSNKFKPVIKFLISKDVEVKVNNITNEILAEYRDELYNKYGFTINIDEKIAERTKYTGTWSLLDTEDLTGISINKYTGEITVNSGVTNRKINIVYTTTIINSEDENGNLKTITARKEVIVSNNYVKIVNPKTNALLDTYKKVNTYEKNAITIVPNGKIYEEISVDLQEQYLASKYPEKTFIVLERSATERSIDKGNPYSLHTGEHSHNIYLIDENSENYITE